MIFDAQSLFSDAQAITGDAPSTNTIDLGVPGTPKHAKGPITQDIGKAHAIPLRIQVVEGFNNLTSLNIEMETDSDVAFGSAKTVTTISVPLADLEAGYVAPMVYVPRGVDARYVRLNYDVVGTAPTTGKITAGLVFGNEAWSA